MTRTLATDPNPGEAEMTTTTAAIARFTGSYKFLSNFHPCTIRYEGQDYPTTEHAYQAAKTFNLVDREKIARLKKPGEAKKAGQDLKLRKDWETAKIDVMEAILRIKFADKLLAVNLAATGDAELIEGNMHNDRFWGVCKGAGENHLGKLLMKIRKDVRVALGVDPIVSTEENPQ